MGSQLQGLSGVAPHPCLATLISRSPIPGVRVPKALPPTCLEAKQLGWCVSLSGIPLVEGGGALFASGIPGPLNKPIPRRNGALPTQIPNPKKAPASLTLVLPGSLLFWLHHRPGCVTRAANSPPLLAALLC